MHSNKRKSPDSLPIFPFTKKNKCSTAVSSIEVCDKDLKCIQNDQEEFTRKTLSDNCLKNKKRIIIEKLKRIRKARRAYEIKQLTGIIKGNDLPNDLQTDSSNRCKTSYLESTCTGSCTADRASTFHQCVEKDVTQSADVKEKNHQACANVTEQYPVSSFLLPTQEKYIALDCEFVGVGPKRKSALGRCSLVAFDGQVILDIYGYPETPITDYRTPWSGIRPFHMKKAVPFHEARNTVLNLIKDKIVVGHSLHNDFTVLEYKHPKQLVRDTCACKPLREMAGFGRNEPVSLKKLTLNLCKKQIQRKEHCSIEDARATMGLFKLVRVEWETKIAAKNTESPSDCCSTNELSTDLYSQGAESYCDSASDSYLFNDYFWPADLHDWH